MAFYLSAYVYGVGAQETLCHLPIGEAMLVCRDFDWVRRGVQAIDAEVVVTVPFNIVETACALGHRLEKESEICLSALRRHRFLANVNALSADNPVLLALVANKVGAVWNPYRISGSVFLMNGQYGSRVGVLHLLNGYNVGCGVYPCYFVPYFRGACTRPEQQCHSKGKE